VNLSEPELMMFIRNWRGQGASDNQIAGMLNRARQPGRLVWMASDVAAIAGPRRPRRKEGTA
jgi:hypothetical protein